MNIAFLSYSQFLFGLIIFSCSVNVKSSQHTCAGPKFGGIFLADQSTHSVVLLRDLDGNGDAESEDEWNTFFTADDFNEGSFFTIHTGQSGFVYVGDGTTDTVYRLEDINHDGDALDVGESTVWFSYDNAEGFTLPTPNGIWEGDDGAVYILNAGTIGSQPFDAVYRTVDLDGDGSANGPGEATVWCNLSILVSELLGEVQYISSAFELVFIGDTAYIMDSAGGYFLILAAQDTNENGQIDSGELRILLSESDSFGVDDFFSAATKLGPDLVVASYFSEPPHVWTLSDIDGSNTITSTDQVNTVWNGLNQPVNKSAIFNFGIASAQIGSDLYIASNQDGVFRLVDLDHDGKYDSPGEAITFRSVNTDDTIPASRPRNVEVLPEFFQARGYYGVSNVDKQNDVPWDLFEIKNELKIQPENMYENILSIYEVGVPYREGYPTLAGFADGTDDNQVKSFENIFPTAVQYFGTEDFLDTWIRDAINCDGQFSPKSTDLVRGGAITTGILSLLYYWVQFELRFSKIKADDGNFGCKGGAPHNFDEAYAFYYGPRGRSALFEMFAAVEEAGNSSITGEPYFSVQPNEIINSLFIDGIELIAPERPPLGSDECDTVEITFRDPGEVVSPIFPTEEQEGIETILYKSFLVYCAVTSRYIIKEEGLGDINDIYVANIQALRLAVAPTINSVDPEADKAILEALDAKPVNGAKLLETFDKLIEQVEYPTSPPTSSPTVKPDDDDDDHPCGDGAKCHNDLNRNLRA